MTTMVLLYSCGIVTYEYSIFPECYQWQLHPQPFLDNMHAVHTWLARLLVATAATKLIAAVIVKEPVSFLDHVFTLELGLHIPVLSSLIHM